ncbi:hypothetical protein CJ177_43195 [Rhodococcus sp. ACPA1]|nr:hypothetical protein CJ177_43195 [Rhodococcus sp. ACPA1]
MPETLGRSSAPPLHAQSNRPPHTPICGTPQIRTGNGSPIWAVSGDLLLVAIVTAGRPSDI